MIYFIDWTWSLGSTEVRAVLARPELGYLETLRTFLVEFLTITFCCTDDYFTALSYVALSVSELPRGHALILIILVFFEMSAGFDLSDFCGYFPATFRLFFVAV